jgi:hypothetical protein
MRAAPSVPFFDVQAVVQRAVDLKLGDRAQSETEADGRNRQLIALETRGRVLLILRQIDAAFEQ